MTQMQQILHNIVLGWLANGMPLTPPTTSSDVLVALRWQGASAETLAAATRCINEPKVSDIQPSLASDIPQEVPKC